MLVIRPSTSFRFFPPKAAISSAVTTLITLGASEIRSSRLDATEITKLVKSTISRDSNSENSSSLSC